MQNSETSRYAIDMRYGPLGWKMATEFWLRQGYRVEIWTANYRVGPLLTECHLTLFRAAGGNFRPASGTIESWPELVGSTVRAWFEVLYSEPERATKQATLRQHERALADMKRIRALAIAPPGAAT